MAAAAGSAATAGTTASASPSDPIVGFRFGYANVCVAVPKAGSLPDVVADEGGYRQIPAFVAFFGGQVIVGAEAQGHALRNPQQCVFGIKALLGDTESTLAEEAGETAAAPESDPLDQYAAPAVQGEQRGFRIDGAFLSVETVAAALFRKLRVTAESALGGTVSRACVAVPERLSEDGRAVLERAARAAGITIVRFVHDPAAAALALVRPEVPTAAQAESIPRVRRLLVVQVGSRDSTATLLEECAGVLAIVGAESEPVGGQTFDRALLRTFQREFETKTGRSLAGNLRALRRLQAQCEAAKTHLTRNMVANVHVDALADGLDFSAPLTRARFESVCAALLERAAAPAHRVLEACGVAAEQLDEVVLCGGASRIPRLVQLVAALCGREPAASPLDPDALTACGAAMQGDLLARAHHTGSVAATVRVPVAPLPIGVEGRDGRMVVVIPQFRVLPARVVVRCGRRSATGSVIRVYEGDAELVKDNTLIARMAVPPSVTGPVLLTLELATDGRLNLSARTASQATPFSVLHVFPQASASDADGDGGPKARADET